LISSPASNVNSINSATSAAFEVSDCGPSFTVKVNSTVVFTVASSSEVIVAVNFTTLSPVPNAG
jgi:hypothetical protein